MKRSIASPIAHLAHALAQMNVTTTTSAVLGNVIAQLRTQRGIKQGELARAIGVGASTLSRMEKGTYGVSIEQFRMIARHLDLKPAALLNLVDAAEEEVVKGGIKVLSSADAPAGEVMAGIAPVLGPVLGEVIKQAFQAVTGASKEKSGVDR